MRFWWHPCLQVMACWLRHSFCRHQLSVWPWISDPDSMLLLQAPTQLCRVLGACPQMGTGLRAKLHASTLKTRCIVAPPSDAQARTAGRLHRSVHIKADRAARFRQAP